jgi:hypothetical protein
MLKFLKDNTIRHWREVMNIKNFLRKFKIFITFKFWFGLPVGLIIGGLIGYIITKNQVATMILAFGIVILPFVYAAYIVRENLREFKIIFVVLFLLVVTSSGVAYLSNQMSILVKHQIKADVWLAFYGTLIGSAISVIAAVVLSQQQINASKKLQQDNLSLEYKNIEILLDLLLKEEIIRNYKIFKEKYKKHKNFKGVLNLTDDYKFIIVEWPLLKHDTVKLIQDIQYTDMVVNIITLYNFIIDINERIDMYSGITYEGNQVGHNINKLEDLFEKALSSFDN